MFHFEINFTNYRECARYVEKKWIPRNGSVKSSPGARGECNSASKPGTDRAAPYVKRNMSFSPDRKSTQLSDADRLTLALRNRSPKQAAPDPKPEVVQHAKPVASAEEAKRKANVSPDPRQSVVQKVEPSIPQVAKAKPETAIINHAANVSKIHAEAMKENGSVSKMHSVGGPQPEPKAVIQQNASPAAIENKNKLDAGIEELIKDFHWNTQPVSANPLNSVKNEPRMECPTSVHQLQQASPPPHQPQLVPTTVKHFSGSQTAYQSSNGNQLFSQNRGSIGGQVHGTKQMGGIQYLHASMSPAYAAMNPSMFSAMPIAPMHATTSTGAIRPLSSLPTVSVVPMQSPYHYDFSSITHEMLSRR